MAAAPAATAEGSPTQPSADPISAFREFMDTAVKQDSEFAQRLEVEFRNIRQFLAHLHSHLHGEAKD